MFFPLHYGLCHAPGEEWQSKSRDQELRGIALAVLRQQGGRAPIVVTERIGHLASEGKGEGVVLWKEVAIRLDQILQARSSPK
ncbi:DUF6961 family protein [Sphingobium vermicomposti]|uniref:Uncharacterized protein n=1 Tax=Sphingobium vermicomposti TaxID=529005 RepID=A0A846M8T5_9SPHN|nr:hypothetical protein [Sphingobium vermicomposti]NIJ16504.1 hypothetical protein [Sphingobium vermicomposti]